MTLSVLLDYTNPASSGDRKPGKNLPKHEQNIPLSLPANLPDALCIPNKKNCTRAYMKRLRPLRKAYGFLGSLKASKEDPGSDALGPPGKDYSHKAPKGLIRPSSVL